MNRPLTRSAIGCAIACSAFVIGPSLVGAVVANADLVGLGGGGGGIDVLGVDLLGSGGKAKSATGGQSRVGAVFGPLPAAGYLAAAASDERGPHQWKRPTFAQCCQSWAYGCSITPFYPK